MKKSPKLIRKKFEQEKVMSRNMAKHGIHDVILVMDHLKTGFNIGKILRSAEVFSLFEVHLVGTTFFDPYPAKGSFKKVKTMFYDTFEQSYERLKELGYTVYMMSPDTQSCIGEIELSKKSAFVVGHEAFGHSFTSDQFDVERLKIKQFGQTESLNVSIAATICMYEYVRSYKV